VKVDE
jgi:hypothetical protein